MRTLLCHGIQEFSSKEPTVINLIRGSLPVNSQPRVWKRMGTERCGQFRTLLFGMGTAWAQDGHYAQTAICARNGEVVIGLHGARSTAAEENVSTPSEMLVNR